MPRVAKKPQAVGKPTGHGSSQYVCRRGRTLADAFDHLSSLLPCYPPNKKMTKIDTLRLAMMYIKDLRVVANGIEDGAEADEETATTTRRSSHSADVSLLQSVAKSSSDGASDRSKTASPPSLHSSRSSLLDMPCPNSLPSLASPTSSEVSTRTYGSRSSQARSTCSTAARRSPQHISQAVGTMDNHQRIPAPNATALDMLSLPNQAPAQGVADFSQFGLQQGGLCMAQAQSNVSHVQSTSSPSSVGSSMSGDSMLSGSIFDGAFSFPGAQHLQASPLSVRSNPLDFHAQAALDQFNPSLFSRDILQCKLDSLDHGMSQAWSANSSFYSPPRQLGMVGGMRSLYHH